MTKPTSPDCNGCVWPGNCGCFDAEPESLVVHAETLRIILHWAVRAGADSGLYSVRKALQEARKALGHDWMETANATSRAALAEAKEKRTRDAVATIVREHWVENWEHPTYANAVRCMKEGCGWEGQFPGDIADHVAELLTEVD